MTHENTPDGSRVPLERVVGRLRPAHRDWAIFWAVLAIYTIIAAHGGGGAQSAALAFFCGVMLTRELAELLPPNG